MLWEGNLTSGMSPTLINEEVRVFPNPFREKLYVKFSDQYSDYEIVILTMQGKVIKSLKRNDGVMEIDTSNLIPGLYILEIKQRQSKIFQTLIIQN